MFKASIYIVKKSDSIGRIYFLTCNCEDELLTVWRQFVKNEDRILEVVEYTESGELYECELAVEDYIFKVRRKEKRSI